MSVLLVSYDLKQPGRDYQPVLDFLKGFTYCKGLESVWLLDTPFEPAQVRDRLRQLTDANDVVFVVRLLQNWGSYNFYCADWLNDARRTW